MNGAFRFAIQNPWSHDQTGTYFLFYFLFGLTHVRANGKLFNCSVPNCSGCGKMSSSLNLTTEVAFSRLHDSSALQSCCSKTSAKTCGGWGERGNRPLPQIGHVWFSLGLFYFCDIPSLYYLRAWYRLPNKNLSVTVRDRAGTFGFINKGFFSFLKNKGFKKPWGRGWP